MRGSAGSAGIMGGSRIIGGASCSAGGGSTAGTTAFWWRGGAPGGFAAYSAVNTAAIWFGSALRESKIADCVVSIADRRASVNCWMARCLSTNPSRLR
jgi:hypothetical protein